MSDRSPRADNPNSVVCNICGIAYTLPEDEIVGNLPNVLLCSHIFCTTCLRSLEFNNVILCPECKVESTLPEGGVEGLQVDSRIIGLIYTAKMNKMKRDRPRHHRVKSSSSPVEEDTKQGPDVETALKAVEEALSQASENMANLDNIHQTLVKGLMVQVKREKARLLMEIDEAMDRAFTILNRRKGALVAELTDMEQHFPSSRRELGRVEERMRALGTAMQKAKQVGQHPSLESYCDLEQLLETLQASVDVQSFDLKCLSLGSGLSCIAQQDALGRSLKACLKINIGNAKILTDELIHRDRERPQEQAGPNRKAPLLPHSLSTREHSRPQQQQQESQTMMRPPPPSTREPVPPHQEQESLRMTRHTWGPSPSPGPWPLPSSSPVSDSGPNVIIEEIIEEIEEGGEGKDEVSLKSCHQVTTASSKTTAAGFSVGVVPAHLSELQQASERQRAQRSSKKIQEDLLPVSQGKVFQEWVMVTHVVNPNHFYIRHVAEQRACILLSKKINSLCSGERGLFTASDILETGSTVFVKWKEGMWCRATLTELFQRGHLDPVRSCPVPELHRVRVYFQDYGFCKGIALQSEEAGPDLFIRDMNERLRRVDVAGQSEMSRWLPQAIKCSLKDIVPADLTKGWSAEAQDEFRRVVGSASVEMQVFGQERGALLVDLKKAPMDSGSSNMPMSLREYLVFLELARFYSPVAWNAKTVPCGRRPLQFYLPVFPRTNVELNAVVSHIDTPSHFYIQLVDNMEFLLLTAKLQECYSYDCPSRGTRGEDQDLEVYCPVLDQACVARFDDKVWYRAHVIGIPGGRKVEVQFVDFGNNKILSVNDLRKIKDEFFALPAMAIQCYLADVIPLVEGETWSEACIEKFKSLADQRLVTAVATEAGRRGRGLPVRLFETSDSSEPLANIEDLLVNDQLACFKKGIKSKDTQAPVVDTTVWDPPLEGLLAESEPAPISLGQETPEQDQDPQEIQPYLMLPANLKDLRVRLTHVVSPGSFYVQLLQMDTQLKRVYELLKQEYARTEPQEIEWKADMYCAAYNNGVWERGQLCSPVSLGCIAEVVRCDFGNKVKLHVNNLRPLLPSLVGSLVLECSLSEIRPAGGRSTWTATACDFISYYLTGAMAIMTIKENTEQRPVQVSLYCSNRAGQDVSIADFLVSEGLALKERKPQASPMPKLEELSDSDSKFKGLQNRTPNTENQPPTPSSDWSVSPRPLSTAPTPPKPPPRTNPSPEKVKTQAYCPPELPHCGRTLMTISAIGEDGLIYAMTQYAGRQFEQLRERLQQHIKTLPRLKPYTWKSVLGCAVMGSDMLWYRGEVLEVIGGHVKVRYVDQGLVENIPVCHVYPTVLCEDIPQLCMPCQLHGVIPVGRTWQWDAVALLKELLLNRCVDMQVMELPEDPLGCLTVQISLDGMTLSRIMVHHQHASVDQAIASMQEELVVSSHLDLDDWDIDTEGLEDPGPVPRVFSYPNLPEKGERFRVRIKHLRTPNEVFLYPLDGSSCMESGGESLEEALKRVHDRIDRLAMLSDFAIEAPCLAEYSDGKYYRAKLLGFAGLNPVKILVRHVDFGSDDTLPTHKLRQIPAHLLRFPCKAIKVRVAGFRPPRLNLEKERLSYRPEWSLKAALEMIDLLHSCCTASVTATEPELSVFLYDEDGALVYLPLVEKGLADFD
ncbi:RING finger protein 17 [Salvelinus namaycush]|uniref:RING finger protein 17 n=1 Tax=Salvelinus namaycush TaxID=8040 RepID=A0A8U1BY56_SALNM|nr:RING finger protein 17 [Salvelinus namaycush]